MNLVEKHITPKMTKKELIDLLRENEPAIAPSKPSTKPTTKPGTPTKPSKPDSPYQPKPGVKPRPKAKNKLPKWLTFDSLGIDFK